MTAGKIVKSVTGSVHDQWGFKSGEHRSVEDLEVSCVPSTIFLSPVHNGGLHYLAGATHHHWITG